MNSPLRSPVLKQRGFALVSTMAILSLVVMTTIALLSLSSITTKSANVGLHMQVARANARLALVEAISALQVTLGKDQAVCATASIFENHDDPSTPQDESSYVANRHWLGGWKTTHTFQGKEWPVVGKAPDLMASSSCPYALKGIYQDLRHTEPEYTDGQWKQGLRQRWLVSGGETVDYSLPLDCSLDENLLLVGRGSLGPLMENESYQKQKVVVPAVEMLGEDGRLRGRYGFWIHNSNVAAKITQQAHSGNSRHSDDEIFTQSDPALVRSSDGTLPFENFVEDSKDDFAKVISDRTLLLASDIEANYWKERFFDFTSNAYGLHTNVQLGGFKRDLTPLLFGDRKKATLCFERPLDSQGSPLGNLADFDFMSDFPIIAGERHGVVGPSFDAIRNWGLKRYMLGLDNELVAAEVTTPTSSLKIRSNSKWARNQSDGFSPDLSKWASDGPKVLPILTEAGWHNGYSSSGTVGVDANMRFHLAPKVVLWNPYNVRLQMPKMAVLMPNFFRVFRKDGAPTASDNFNVKFYVEDGHVNQLKSQFASVPLIANWGKTQDGANDFSVPGGGQFFSFHVNSRSATANGSWAPRGKYLGFTLEAVTFEPGQCLVFSAKVGGPGAGHQELSETNMGMNLLSASSQAGEDSFYLEPSFPGTEIKLGRSTQSTPALSAADAESFMKHIDFTRVFRYRLENYPHVNPHASLKASESGSFSCSADAAAGSANFVSVQTINCGNAGTRDGQFQMNHIFADSRLTMSLENSDLYPDLVDYPRRFQSGVKLSWLDESGYEGNAQESYRLHPFEGLQPGSLSFHHDVFSQGSVRPHVVTRAPHHFTTYNYYQYQAGNWLASYASPSPDEALEMPLMSSAGTYAKNPFGAASHHDSEGRAVMFDLPSVEYGCLSLSNLRHVNLSPFSWHPTYIIGNSLAALSAPADYSAHPFLQHQYASSLIAENTVSNSFDYYCGGTRSISSSNKYSSKRWWSHWSGFSGSRIRWGPSTGNQSWAYGFTNNESLLHIGEEKASKTIDGVSIDSSDEILAYDISFEVNQNLYDGHFLSGMPLNQANDTQFAWGGEDRLHNPNYRGNIYSDRSRQAIAQPPGSGVSLTERPAGLAFGFWNNGYLLQSDCQFNVNSTSVEAWCAILSGMRNQTRKTILNNTIGGDGKHVISRLRKPLNGDLSNAQDAASSSPFAGARVLTDEEIRLLANHIVRQIKIRGPFLSLADFVNRRLSRPSTRTDKAVASYAQKIAMFDGSDDPTSRMGALEAAIQASGINAGLEKNSRLAGDAYDTVDKDETTKPFGTHAAHRGYATHVDWQPDYSHRQVHTKVWGAPSYLTQADLLGPLSPSISVRGDSFTIRCAGQSIENGEVMAVAYLEAKVVRTPEYVSKAAIFARDEDLVNQQNRSNTPAIIIHPRTGELLHTPLSQSNKTYGRRFKVLDTKWLLASEI